VLLPGYRRHNDLEGYSNFSGTVYSFSILYLERHYCGDQQWRSMSFSVEKYRDLEIPAKSQLRLLKVVPLDRLVIVSY